MNRIIGDLIQSRVARSRRKFHERPASRRHAFELHVLPGGAQARIKLHKRNSAADLGLRLERAAADRVQGRRRFCANSCAARSSRIISASCKRRHACQAFREGPPSVRQCPQDRAVRRNRHRSAGRARLLCDHLSGMTDAYALQQLQAAVRSPGLRLDLRAWIWKIFCHGIALHHRADFPRDGQPAEVHRARCGGAGAAIGAENPPRHRRRIGRRRAGVDQVARAGEYSAKSALPARASGQRFGLGTRLHRRVSTALRDHAEACSAVVQMDADLSHDPAAIGDFLAQRYWPTAPTSSWPPVIATGCA